MKSLTRPAAEFQKPLLELPALSSPAAVDRNVGVEPGGGTSRPSLSPRTPDVGGAGGAGGGGAGGGSAVMRVGAVAREGGGGGGESGGAGAGGAGRPGLTLVQLLAQRKRCWWDKGYLGVA